MTMNVKRCWRGDELDVIGGSAVRFVVVGSQGRADGSARVLVGGEAGWRLVEPPGMPA